MNIGSDRRVVRDGDWVIKTQRIPGEWRDNMREAANYALLRDSGMLPDNVRIPETILLPTGQIKMRFVTGTPCAECLCIDGERCDEMCLTQEEYLLVSQFISDLGGMNVIRDADGILWLIDLA